MANEKIKARQNKLREARTRPTSQRRSLNAIIANRERLRALEMMRTQIYVHLARINNEILNLKRAKNKIILEIDKIRSEIESRLGEEDFYAVIKRLSDRIDKKLDRDEFLSFRDKTKNDLENLDNKIEQYKFWKDRADDIEKLKQTLRIFDARKLDVKDFNKEVRDINKSISSINKRIQDAVDVIKNVKKHEKRIKNLEVLKENFATPEEVDEIFNDYYVKISSKIDSLVKQIEAMEKESKDLKRVIKIFEQRLNENKEMKKDISKLRREIERLKKKLKK